MITIPGKLHAASWDIPHDLATVPGARRQVRRALSRWTLEELADDVALVVGELLANAICHGAPPIRLSLWRTRGVLCVRVTDHGMGHPHQLDPEPESVHGRGLAIVAALAGEFGVFSLPNRPGKVAWARWTVKSGQGSGPTTIPKQRQP
ncbi:ATP-binding protein [Sphaerisporangium sp. NPDC051017]|uniref:ATP-binding protein n=1 Tax=Sphaerisporangium sp. NPDC051017 TaxID=3154636 RepID=UPI0034455C6D